MSLAEVMVGLVLFTVGLIGLLGATAAAASTTIRARSDLQWWAAVQWKADSLIAVGADNVTNGSDVVGDFLLKWEVTPKTTPLQVDLTIGRTPKPGRSAVADTLVLYLVK